MTIKKNEKKKRILTMIFEEIVLNCKKMIAKTARTRTGFILLLEETF